MPIPVVEKTKFLGLIFYRKLSFIPHLYYLKEKCLKAINLLRVVAHTSWGANQQTLLHLCKFLIGSKLDYGCTVYGSVGPSYLKILEPIYNHALRLSLGASRTSPAVSLCVQATESLIALRRKKLALQHCLKLVQIPITRHTMQFLIQGSKLSLTTSRAKLAHWALELKTTCRSLALKEECFTYNHFHSSTLAFQTP